MYNINYCNSFSLILCQSSLHKQLFLFRSSDCRLYESAFPDSSGVAKSCHIYEGFMMPIHVLQAQEKGSHWQRLRPFLLSRQCLTPLPFFTERNTNKQQAGVSTLSGVKHLVICFISDYIEISCALTQLLLQLLRGMQHLLGFFC